jgi:hypothetical protein
MSAAFSLILAEMPVRIVVALLNQHIGNIRMSNSVLTLARADTNRRLHAPETLLGIGWANPVGFLTQAADIDEPNALNLCADF